MTAEAPSGKGADPSHAPADVSELLSKWITTASEYAVAHRNEALALKKYHTRLGAPSVALSAIVGTSIFAAIQEAAQSLPLKLVLASFSMGAGALAALVTFYSFGDRSAAHRISSQEYEDIARRLEILKTSVASMPAADWRNLLEGYSQRLDSIGKRADIPSSMVISAKVKVSAYGPGGPSTMVVSRPKLPREGFPEELDSLFLQSTEG